MGSSTYHTGRMIQLILSVYAVIFLITILSFEVNAQTYDINQSYQIAKSPSLTINPTNSTSPNFIMTLDGIGFTEGIGYFIIGSGSPNTSDYAYIYEYDEDFVYKRTINISDHYNQLQNTGALFNGTHYYITPFGTSGSSPKKMVFDNNGIFQFNMTFEIFPDSPCGGLGIDSISGTFISPYIYMPCSDSTGSIAYVVRFDGNGNYVDTNFTTTQFYVGSDNLVENTRYTNVAYHDGKVYMNSRRTSIIGEWDQSGNLLRSGNMNMTSITNNNFVLGITDSPNGVYVVGGSTTGIRNVNISSLRPSVPDLRSPISGGQIIAFTKGVSNWYAVNDEGNPITNSNFIWEYDNEFKPTGQTYYIGNYANQSRGIVAKDSSLFVLDDTSATTGRILEFDFPTKRLLNIFNLQNGSTNERGIKWDGVNFWIKDRNGAISKYDESFVYQGQFLNVSPLAPAMSSITDSLFDEEHDIAYANNQFNRTLYLFNDSSYSPSGSASYMGIILNFTASELDDITGMDIDFDQGILYLLSFGNNGLKQAIAKVNPRVFSYNYTMIRSLFVTELEEPSDVIAPNIISDYNVTGNSYPDSVVNVSALFTDDIDLSLAVFSFNDTGITIQNNFTLNGTSDFASIIHSINCEHFCILNISIGAYDEYGNFDSDESLIEIQDRDAVASVYLFPNITYPSLEDISAVVGFFDPDPGDFQDGEFYEWEINGSIEAGFSNNPLPANQVTLNATIRAHAQVADPYQNSPFVFSDYLIILENVTIPPMNETGNQTDEDDDEVTTADAINNLINVIIALIFFIISITAIIIGKMMKNGLVGLIGCLILLTSAINIGRLNLPISLLLSLMALLLMWFFYKNGSEYNL